MRLILGFLAVGALAAAVSVLSLRSNPSPPPEPVVEAAPPAPEFVTEIFPIQRGDTLEVVLGKAGLEAPAKFELIAAVREAFDVRKFRAGSDLVLTRSLDGVLQSVEYVIDPDHKLEVAHCDGAFAAAVVEIPGVVRAVPINGVLEGSLFESIARIGEQPDLAIRMAEIFAWDIDFYTDPQPGDEFSLLVEKKEYDNGQPPTYQRILAAKYVNKSQVYEGFLFPDPDGKPGYYSRDGKSLQAAFLRSPLQFAARISSHFSPRRFHPVLKIYRPHLGTDYAAPTGTPVQAIASGTVTFSGYSGGAGNMVTIRHANGFESSYLHLSRRYVKKGQKVAQSHRIGLVGATGLATGPHLDFRVKKNGKYLNFESMKPPRRTEVPAEQRDLFAALCGRYSSMWSPGPQPDLLLLAEGPAPATAATSD